MKIAALLLFSSTVQNHRLTSYQPIGILSAILHFMSITMPTLVFAYGLLIIAIVTEVTGASLLQRTEQFTRLGPSILTVLCYAVSFYVLSHILKVLPLGVAYAIWAGLGIVLTAFAGVVLYKQSIDFWGMVGIAMIVGGVIIMNVLSKTVSH